MRNTIIQWGLICFLWAGIAGGAENPDPGLPSFTPTTDLKGHISSVGSDTLAPAMKRWVRKFISFHQQVSIAMRARGSSLAPPALTAGKAQLGPMSRPMKPQELAAFRSTYGYDPTAVQVAFDALTIFVHYTNPVKQLTLAQVDAIFSDERRCGSPQAIQKWGDLGLEGPWAEKPVQLYGRRPASGTYGFFRKKALCDGRYKASLTERGGNASLVQSIALRDPGIGYAGVSYSRMGSLRGLLLAADENSAFVAATPENALNGTYPLARPLYIYINKRPGFPVAEPTAEFLRMVLSDVGQKAVERSGYIPLPADIVRQELAKLQ